MADDKRDEPTELLPRPPKGELQPEPPVVARVVVEIRSDGSRTIARGAVEDVQTGTRTALEARGDSPMQLALQLARTLTQLPAMALKSSLRSSVRGLLGRRRGK